MSVLRHFASNGNDVVFCIQCLQIKASSKRFSLAEKTKLRDHLIEEHGIFQLPAYTKSLELESASETLPEQIIQYQDEECLGLIEYDEEISQEANVLSSPKKHSSIWSFFQKDVSGSQLECVLCQSEGKKSIYAQKSSTSTLRKHLQVVHSVVIEKDRKTVVTGKKTRPVASKVWRYFVKKNSSDEESFLYCRRCLDSEITHKYSKSSSTGTLWSHLKNAHGIDESNELQEDSEQELEKLEEEPTIGQSYPDPPLMIKRARRVSSVRTYFISQAGDPNYIFCSLCAKQKTAVKYSTSTSTSTLKAHLFVRHQIDPRVHETQKPSQLVKHSQTPCKAVPEEVLEVARGVVAVTTRKIRTYFLPIDEDLETVYCAFCLVESQKKGYKTRTATSGLRRHLCAVHNFDPVKMLENNSNQDVADPGESIRKRSKRKTSGVWMYFCQRRVLSGNGVEELDKKNVYCTLCWNAPIREIQKYSVSTSISSLRNHLMSRHAIVTSKLKSRCRKEEILVEADEDEKVFADDTEPSAQSKEDFDEEEEYVKEVVEVVPVPPPIQCNLERRVLNYCRSCGKTDDGHFTKFCIAFLDTDDPISPAASLTLGDLYLEVTGIEVRAEDGMSQLICFTCAANLKSSYKFKTNALETENAMQGKMQEGQLEVETASTEMNDLFNQEDCDAYISFDDLNPEDYYEESNGESEMKESSEGVFIG